MIDLHPKILSTNGEPQFAVLPYAEFLQVKAALARITEKTMEDPRYGSFYDNLSAEELARRQGINPAESVEQLYGTGDPADWEGFDEALEEWRSPSK
jgi:hypothetical protein